ncbi:hypothetical protein NDU88_001498, partial [Pleurodeles waltl]
EYSGRSHVVFAFYSYYERIPSVNAFDRGPFIQEELQRLRLAPGPAQQFGTPLTNSGGNRSFLVHRYEASVHHQR